MFASHDRIGQAAFSLAAYPVALILVAGLVFDQAAAALS